MLFVDNLIEINKCQRSVNNTDYDKIMWKANSKFQFITSAFVIVRPAKWTGISRAIFSRPVNSGVTFGTRRYVVEPVIVSTVDA